MTWWSEILKVIVALLVSAWIEIICLRCWLYRLYVALLVTAWIESF